MFVVFVTRYNADMTEGRGPMVNDMAFSRREDAAQYIDGKHGVMGRRPITPWSQQPHGDWDIVEITVAETVEEVQRIMTNERRARALAKLTKDDREALGLTGAWKTND
jgi:hypothetical protein